MINYITSSNQDVASTLDNRTLIKVNNVSKIFTKSIFNLNNTFINKSTPYSPTIDNVSFNIRIGQTVGLIGASGSGKSTLGKMLVRLIRPSYGNIIYKNQDIFSLSNRKFKPFRSDLQIVFQDPFSSFNNLLTIEKILIQNIQVPKNSSIKFKQQVIDNLIQLVGLKKNIKDKYPYQLSGGECQRVSIARSLSVNPKFIVFDEATSALDAIIQNQIINTIKDIQQKLNLTYFFISHNIGLVKDISDHIIVLFNGHIVESGKPYDIYFNPQHPYTKKLIKSFKDLHL